MKKLKSLCPQYKSAIPLLIYMAVYGLWFAYLEKNINNQYHVIHMSLDDKIPFCEYFVIPYFMWFAYVAVVVVYLFWNDLTEYKRTCIFLCTGMTIFLIISTLWPNGHHLRPYTFAQENLFTDLVRMLWKTDTPTNLWPSIHVFNSIGAHLGVLSCKKLEKLSPLRWMSFFLSVAIILSTMLIKQHSVFDVITAFIMAFILYLPIYKKDDLQQSIRSLREKVHSFSH